MYAHVNLHISLRAFNDFSHWVMIPFLRCFFDLTAGCAEHVVPFNVKIPYFSGILRATKNSCNPINLIKFTANCSTVFFWAVFHLFMDLFSEEKLNPTNKMGIIRQMPAEILRMSPAEVDDSLVGTAPRWRPWQGGTDGEMFDWGSSLE